VARAATSHEPRQTIPKSQPKDSGMTRGKTFSLGKRTVGLLMLALAASAGLAAGRLIAEQPAQAVADLEPPTVEAALAAWETGCRAIAAYDVFITGEETKFLDPKKGSGESTPQVRTGATRQVFCDGKRRFERGVRKPGEVAAATSVWDGKESRSLYEARQFIIDTRFYASNEPGGDYEKLYKTPNQGVCYVEIIRQRPEKKVESATDAECVVYTPHIYGEHEFAPYGFRVWLDRTKNYLPRRIEMLLAVPDKDVEVVTWRCDNTLEEVAPGVWAPMKSVVNGFPQIVQKEEPAIKTFVGLISVSRKWSRFNMELPADTFLLDAPSGVPVTQRLNGVSPDDRPASR
jgi:hypothetical protein